VSAAKFREERRRDEVSAASRYSGMSCGAAQTVWCVTQALSDMPDGVAHRAQRVGHLPIEAAPGSVKPD
jgi:hypothetical protein